MHMRNILTATGLAALLVVPMTAASQANGKGSTQGFPGANGQPFQALQNEINNIESTTLSQIARLEAQIQTLGAQNALEDSLISSLQGELFLLQQRMTSAEGSITQLQSDLQSYITLQTQLNASFQTRLNNDDAALAQDGDNIQLLFNENQALQGYIVSLQQEASFLQGQIDGLHAQIAGLGAQTDQNTADINTLTGELQAVTDQLTQVNLTLNSLTAELAQKQPLITGACGSGSAIQQIKPDGTVACVPISEGVGQLDVQTFTTTQSVGFNAAAVVGMACPSGTKLTGGGFNGVAGNALFLQGSFPINFNLPGISISVWDVAVINLDLFSNHDITAVAQCARVVQ